MFILITVFDTAFTQIPPTLDGNWVLDTAKSDEFDGTLINSNKWYDISFPYLQATGFGSDWCGVYIFSNNRKWLSNGELVLDYQYFPGQTYKHQTGGIKSINFDFSYGYYEIYAKLPGYYESGTPTGRGFWPTFWLYYLESQNGCLTKHDEIDILEPSGCTYFNANANAVNVWDEKTNPNYPNPNNSNECQYIGDHSFGFENDNLPPLFEDYHKYAAEWLPNKIVFYFDDVPFYSINNHHSIPDVPMRVMIDFQLTVCENLCWQQPPEDTLQMKVKYFRYYELNQNCNNDAFITSNTELNNFIFQVKRNITIGNGLPSVYLFPNQKIELQIF
ncbi:MAG: family 16 glycosylhydrolase [Flavobacteriales bacterium]|nr:family 16 glycosylhydrolase [Flavobacteriales bacterium]